MKRPQGMSDEEWGQLKATRKAEKNRRREGEAVMKEQGEAIEWDGQNGVSGEEQAEVEKNSRRMGKSKRSRREEEVEVQGLLEEQLVDKRSGSRSRNRRQSEGVRALIKNQKKQASQEQQQDMLEEQYRPKRENLPIKKAQRKPRPYIPEYEDLDSDLSEDQDADLSEDQDADLSEDQDEQFLSRIAKTRNIKKHIVHSGRYRRGSRKYLREVVRAPQFKIAERQHRASTASLVKKEEVKPKTGFGVGSVVEWVAKNIFTF